MSEVNASDFDPKTEFDQPDSSAISKALASALEHHRAGRLREAEPIYRQILAADPNQPDAWHLLGVIAFQTGKHREAVDCIRRALAHRPGWAEAWSNLGNVCREQKNLDEAAACLQRALQLKPDYAGAHYNLGIVSRDRGHLDEAANCYRRAVQSQPDFAEAHNNLGNVLKDQYKLDEAIPCFQRALQLKPDFAEAHNNLGTVFKDRKRLDEAADCFRRALQLKPDYIEALSNLGTLFKDRGELDEAMVCFRRAVELKPASAEVHSNLVCTLYYLPHRDAQVILDEHRHWSRQHAEPLTRLVQPHVSDRTSGRRLRVGYVSPDFCSHPVGRFMLPLLEQHDHDRFEVFCYASMTAADAVTGRCRAVSDVWRDVAACSDEQLAETIRRDRIDVLVDLTMHSARNRLLVFARKPAPVQVTYLAYCGTTGLETIDYRLTDPYLDPPSGDDSCYSECSVRLPETYWCYELPAEIPDVNASPAGASSHVTFGCLNNFCKVTTPALEAWARILQALPSSRLLLHAHPGGHRARGLDFLARRGVSPDRLTFAGGQPTAEYFRLYHGIDVALDPFPYGGGTTTCDALVMGVPVISLAGETAVGRAGKSILSNAGLADLVARDVGQYERIAVELALDLARLSGLRADLRDRMKKSPLMDQRRFAQHVEQAYQAMWTIYASGESPRAIYVAPAKDVSGK